MEDLAFVELDESHVRILELWLEDPESQRRLGRLAPVRTWFDYALASPGYFVWMIFDGVTAVGAAGFEMEDDETASLVFVVDPDLRNRGYGKQILALLLTRPEAARLKTLKAFVDADNDAHLHCLDAAGFVKQGPNPEDPDSLVYVHTLG